MTENERENYSNWIIDNDSSRQTYATLEPDLPEQPYRLYRFLTDLEDILLTIPDDRDRLKAIFPLVRKLLMSSYWLQMEYHTPNPETGWSVNTLYKEQDYPITIQTVAWLPGNVSPIHNHATWGIVALIDGQEKNRFWKRSPDKEYPHKIELIDEYNFIPGDIIGLMPDAIHSVEPLGEEPTITFNIYGETDFSQRYEFDSVKYTVKNF
ncbi:MAG: cupin [Xenococcus sp. MO_188.B8]|nr:cupin [Xenococcus sp. MO_188.B8]